MPHGPRRFAKNSENTRHFRLVARSQKDTEGDKEESSGLVLEPFIPNRLIGRVDEAEHMSIPESLQGLDPAVFGLQTRGGIPEEGSSEEEEYDDDEEQDELAALDDDCYFPKDGYNYNQHLRTLSSNKKKKGGVGGVVIEAPKRNKDQGTKEEEQKAMEMPVPETKEEDEVMQALMDCDNPGYEECDDDFLGEILPGGAIEPDLVLWGPAALEDADLPDLAIFKEMHAQRLAAMAGGDDDEPYIEEDEEGSQQPRPAVSNARFEQVLQEEYAEEEDGALSDDEEIEGEMTAADMEAMLDEYLEDRQVEKQKLDSLNEPIKGKYDDDVCPRVTAETKAIIERLHLDEVDEDNADAETSEGDSDEDESKNWDCETVLSTLSNLSNRPGKITKIKLVKKAPAGKDLAAIKEDVSGAEESSDEDAVDLPDVITDRPKDETPEQKKARKAGVKEMRRICRKMKKESKEMYKAEAAKMNKQPMVGDVRQKLRVQKL